MGMPSAFADCLAEKDLDCLHAIYACLHKLHEQLVADAAALGEHLERIGQLGLRHCNLCGAHIDRDAINDLLQMTAVAIAAKEGAHG